MGGLPSMLSAAVFARNKSCEYDTITVYEESNDKDKFFRELYTLVPNILLKAKINRQSPLRLL